MKRTVRACQNCRFCAPVADAFKAHPDYAPGNILCRSCNGIMPPVEKGCRDFEPKPITAKCAGCWEETPVNEMSDESGELLCKSCEIKNDLDV